MNCTIQVFVWKVNGNGRFNVSPSAAMLMDFTEIQL